MPRQDMKGRLAQTRSRKLIILSILLFSMVALTGQAQAAVRTFAITGTVGSSTFDGITNGTSFTGTYTVDDATGDTDASGDIGIYPTGEIFLDIDGVGTVTFDQSPSTVVRDDAPAPFSMEEDSLQITAGEGSRSLSFTNAIDPATLKLATVTAGAPTTLTSDSLSAALSVDFASWQEGGAISFFVEDAGDASCEALATSCGVRLDIASAGEGFPLTVTKDGDGTGTVTSSPIGIDCGATCSAPFDGSVMLTATPDPGSIFVAWTGCDSTSGDECTVQVDSPTAVNATFAIETFMVTVTKTGSGDGTVVSNPAGIDCGATCSAPFVGMVTLEATASPGSTFAGWTGCDSVSGTTCSLLVDGSDLEVEAAFDADSSSIQEIPTVSEWGLILLSLLLAAAGIWAMAGRFV